MITNEQYLQEAQTPYCAAKAFIALESGGITIEQVSLLFNVSVDDIYKKIAEFRKEYPHNAAMEYIENRCVIPVWYIAWKHHATVASVEKLLYCEDCKVVLTPDKNLYVYMNHIVCDKCCKDRELCQEDKQY